MCTISLCMIVKNEEDVLGRCLKSVCDLVDEIIIVDTGSTDRTKEIAARYTQHIYDFVWMDDFAAARNHSFSLATKDYCMWLDADDLLLAEDRQKFLVLKQKLLPSADVVMMPYHTGFDENQNVTFSYYRERIVKNHLGMKWVGAVHEAIQTVGKVAYAECAITHRKLHPSDPDRNLRIFEKLIAQSVKLGPREQFYYGRELYYHNRYREALDVFKAFLDEGAGWVENEIEACRHCAYCWYRLDKPNRAITALFQSFLYDLPRAEICCDIGYHFFDRQAYHKAIYWYKQALSCERKDKQGGFVSLDAYGYLPCIQLCVCYSRLHDWEKAIKYNEKAAESKPNAEAVALNRAYLSSQSSAT